MKGSGGHTVVELLVATAVLLAAGGAILRVVHDGIGRSAFWNESADLHQRSRVATSTFFSLVTAAGAGPHAGSLWRSFAPIEPRRRTSGGTVASAITVRFVPAHAPWATLLNPFTPAAGVITLRRHSGCPQGTIACGFESGMDAIVFDAAGNWDTLLVQSIGPHSLLVTDRAAVRSVTYPAGAQVAQIVETTLYLDPSERTVRREHPWASNLPLLDNVLDLQFEYFGDPLPPEDPRPPAGTANCLYDAAGARVAHPVLPADHGALATLPISMLADGPMCGSGATAYDVDLLRIRKVRAGIRLQTGITALRGRDPRLFAQPGAARASDRMLPDVSLTLSVTPRNLR